MPKIPTKKRKRQQQKVAFGDCVEVLERYPAATFSVVVCDPPYGLKFMGKQWDHGVPGIPFWQEFLRVVKPGGFLLAFGGTRTFHRLTCAIEDAGWEIRDDILDLLATDWKLQAFYESLNTEQQGAFAELVAPGRVLAWLYGSGFPKSHDISKAIDKTAGAEREVVGKAQGAGSANTESLGRFEPEYDATAPATPAAQLWQGYGTALKPAWEPIVVAMKPIEGTFAENAVKHGVAGLNVDGGRVGTEDRPNRKQERNDTAESILGQCRGKSGVARGTTSLGRWPANVILQHHPECVRVGVKRVKPAGGGGYVTKASDRAIWGGGKEGPGSPGYVDADGLETVEEWECVPDCPVGMLGEQSGPAGSNSGTPAASDGTAHRGQAFFGNKATSESRQYDTRATGTAARFFYTAKASRGERNAGCEGLFWHDPDKSGEWTRIDEAEHVRLEAENDEAREAKQKLPHRIGKHNVHPTVKPLGIMEYLLKLVSMPKGTYVLDPFMGSGSTIVACKKLGLRAVGIDNDRTSVTIASHRLRHTNGG